jgi:pimeloyl-ACP methyl ester carboxylesterase
MLAVVRPATAGLLFLLVGTVLADEIQGNRAMVNGHLGPPTPSTCYWTEREFEDLPERGPALAPGIVLWNHGQATGHPSWQFGAPPVIRLFAESGWDVLLVQRNPICEGNWSAKGREYVETLVNEVRAAKKRGYRRILVAGQSMGAGIALGAAEKTDQIGGVMAFALSHGRRSCRDARTIRPGMIAFHERQIERAIREARSPRILISMGKDDHCVGHSFSPLVSRTLAARDIAYIYLDESMAIAGHGAATGQQFASLYGDCVLKFFSQEDKPENGRRSCAVPRLGSKFVFLLPENT